MKKFYTIAMMMMAITMTAQEDVMSTTAVGSDAIDSNETIVGTDSISDRVIKKNYLKWNVTGLLFNNLSFQYERVLSKRVSFAISYRTMSKGDMPFKSSIVDDTELDDPESTSSIINDIQMGNSAITPEIRFYLGKKGYGKGFYIAPYYRYAKFDISGANIEFEIEDEFVQRSETLAFSGTMTSHSFGLYFGAQWELNKWLVLDWWIVGGHYGTGKGDFSAKFSQTLTDDEFQYVQDNLPEIDLPLVDNEFSITKEKAKLKLDGPWAGLRAGISLGIRF